MGIRENIELDIAGKAVKQTDKPLSDEFADRVRWSALSSLVGAAIAASPMLLRKKKFKDVKIPMAAFGLGGVPLGWNLPRTHNKYLEYVQGKATKSDAQEAYTKLVEEESDVRKRSPILFNQKKRSLLKKEAKFLSVAANLTSKTVKSTLGGAAATAKGIGRGVMGSPGTSKLQRVVSRGSVGILGAAGAVGGVGAIRSRRRLSGNNYTTFLRNNILAGNIQPAQLSQQDLVSVRRLGMR